MFNGLKARRQLAAYVALGLSTGGGLLFYAPSAHAMDVTILPTDTEHVSGVNGTAETNQKDGNNVTIGTSGATGPVINGDVVGGSSAAADVANNKVTINSITLGSGNTVYGGQSMGGAASNNTVTINGGTLNSSNKIIGGSGTAGSTSNGNVVNLNGGSLHGAEVWGSYYGNNNTLYQSDSDKIKGNTLNVGASGLEVERLRNFENYNFNLTDKVTAGSVMLDIGDSRAFGFQTPAEWSKITLTGKENDTDKTKYGRVGTITLMSSHSGGGLSINGYAVGGKTGTTGDYEYKLYTDNSFVFLQPVGANYVRADVDRYQNSDAEYNGTAVTNNTVYGGYSSLGNTTTNNKIKITNTNNTNLNVYGGYTAGDGNATNNHVTITATGKVKAAYGGRTDSATGKAEGNTVTIETGGWVDDNSYAGWAKGAANRNIFTVKGHADWSVYGGRIDDAGDTAEGNEVRIEGGTVNGHAVGGKGGTGTTVTGNKVTVTSGTVKKDITGGQVSGANGKATGNIVTITDSTAEGFVNGGSTVDGGTASGNQINISGSTIKKAITGGYDSTNGSVTGNTVTVSGSSTVEETIYGGYSHNTGTVTDNSVAIAGGTFQETIYGGYSNKSGTVTGNKVALTGGTFQNVIYGGAGGDPSSTETFTVNKNTVTIAGGTFSSNIYGGYSWKADGTTENNTVNLGDDTHHDLSGTTLSASNISGGNRAATGNTLNVKAKNAVVKSVRNFENVNFHMNDDITDGSTMLTVNNDGLGGTVDWEKVKVLAESLTSAVQPNREVTLLKSNAVNALQFSNYSARNLITDPNSDYESVMRTDSDSGTATAVTLRTNRWRNSEWTYDGTNPSTVNEVAGGISYDDNHTTYNNQITVTGVPHGGLAAAYGGKTYGDADSKNNAVFVQGTAEHIPSVPTAHDSIGKVYGGYTQAANRTAEGNNAILAKGNVGDLYGGMAEGERGTAKNNTVVLTQEAAGVSGTVTQNTYGGAAIGAGGTAAGNRAIITAGTAHDVYGGMVSGAVSTGTPNKVSTADGNIVQMIGGSAANIYGGDALDAADGTASHNKVSVTGGTVNGNIAGGRAKYGATNAVSNGNTVTFGAEDGSHGVLGATLAAGMTVYGTNYQDTSGDVTFDGNDAAVAGNTLNVNAKNVTVGAVRNFENFNFNLGDTAKNGDTMLSLSQAGGFGTTSGSTSAPVKVDWTKVKADTSHLSTVRGQGAHGKNTITLMEETASTAAGDLLNFANYTAAPQYYSGTDRDYETKMHTDGNAASTERVVLELNRFRNDSVLHDGTTPPDAVYGGYSAYDDTAVDANGDHLGHTAENNMLGITGVFSGTSNLKAYGGYAGGDHSAAVNNHVNVNVQNTTPGVVDSVYGGYASGSHAGAVRGNTATLDSGIVVDTLAGGYADSANSAGTDHNTVRINGGTVGTYTDPSTSATVTHDAKVYGGYGATATDNTVDFASGKVTGTIYGGYAKTLPSAAAAVKNNVVKLGDNAEVVGDVYGGYADAVPGVGIAAATDNTIDLYKATISGVLYGGAAKDSANNTVANGTGNTLSVRSFGAQAGDVTGVQNLHFYIPAGTTGASAAASGAMLTLNNVTHDLNASGEKDLSSVNIGVALAGNQPTLQVGDEVSLVKAFAGTTPVALSPRVPTVNHTTGMQGVSMLYGFDILTRPTSGSTVNNELYAGVTSASINPQTKSLAETRAASLAFMSGGSDLLTDAALTAALDAASTPASGAGQVNGAPKEYHMWAVQSGSSVRLNTGSHVDAKGWNIDLGFAKQRASGRNILTYGPFVEYGKGSYDSYLDDGVHGDGSMDYLGAGFMAKSTNENGSYVEGSVRAGRVKSDYAGTISGTHVTYDSSSTYYAGHLGVGQEKALHGGNTIETYAKYFFAHQDGDRTTLSNGDVYDFDAADSHRLRVGTRYTTKHGSGSFYTGLAYEYEFSGDAGASYQGYNTPSPSLKGGTGILELGYRFAPKDERVSYGVNLMGMTGKRRGVSGGVQMHWAF